MKKNEAFRWTLTRRWENRLGALLMLLAVAGGVATYAALREVPPMGNDPDTVIWLLNLDVVILVLLVGLIARRLVSVWSGRKRGLAGSHLHVRLVYIFSLIAAAPVIVMTIFCALFLQFGLQTWFAQRVETAVHESQAVAEAYLEEHTQTIRADTLAMAGDIDRQVGFLAENLSAFSQIVQTQSSLRNLSEAIVFDKAGRVLVRSGLTFSLEFENIPDWAMDQAEEGDVVVLTGGGGDRVRALIKLNNLAGTYLYVGRLVDPQVLSHVSATRAASKDYATLQKRYSHFQVVVTMMFVLVGVLLILAAVWLGLILARQLVSPIGVLTAAADRIRAGDLSTQVEKTGSIQEFDYLAQAFNRMIRQIYEQQNQLLAANRQLDRRRRFTESVLTGVSSGVLGIDAAGTVSLANSAAIHLLGLPEDNIVGQPIAQIMPQIKSYLEQAGAALETRAEQIQYARPDKTRHIFLVQADVQRNLDQNVEIVLTFDDMTELQSAQRKAAWSDVARRIAHEIKNPLTPIQLAAERLRRKYMSEIKTDPDVFSQCIETIVRHVGDIGRMVSEFSSFARMPEPAMKTGNLEIHVGETLFLHRQAHPDINFDFSVQEPKNVTSLYDPQQIRQALNNLIQNAVDSIYSRIQKDQDAGLPVMPGRINVNLMNRNAQTIAMIVSDNGLGLPDVGNPIHLTEPYVTHKAKGTGLGLAIVKKIVEDHKGELYIGVPDWLAAQPDWRDAGGATFVIVLRKHTEHSKNQPEKMSA